MLFTLVGRLLLTLVGCMLFTLVSRLQLLYHRLIITRDHLKEGPCDLQRFSSLLHIGLKSGKLDHIRLIKNSAGTLYHLMIGRILPEAAEQLSGEIGRAHV